MTEQPQEIRLDGEDRQLIFRIIRDHKVNAPSEDLQRFLDILDECCDDYDDRCANPLLNTTSDRRSKLLFKFADSLNQSTKQMDFLLDKVDLQLAIVTAYHHPKKTECDYPKLPDGTDDIFVNSLQSLDTRLIYLRDQLTFLESYSSALAVAHKKDKPIHGKNAPLHFLANDLARALYFVLGVEPSTTQTGLFACVFREMRRIVTKGVKSKDNVSNYVVPAVKAFTKEND